MCSLPPEMFFMLSIDYSELLRQSSDGNSIRRWTGRGLSLCDTNVKRLCFEDSAPRPVVIIRKTPPTVLGCVALWPVLLGHFMFKNHQMEEWEKGEWQNKTIFSFISQANIKDSSIQACKFL